MSIPASVQEQGKEGQWALRLTEFNLHCARYAHESWYSASLKPALLSCAERSEPSLSRWLLSEAGGQEEMDWEMDELPKRLWLLDAASLRRGARDLALAMHRDWLVQCIDGERVRALQTKVSKEALRFVIQDVPSHSLHFNTPQVSFETDSTIEVQAKLQNAGARALMGLLQPAWRAVRARAQLVFDRALGLSEVPVLEGERADRALDLVFRKLIPGRLAEWAWLF